VEVTGSSDPLPTTIEVGVEEERGWVVDRLSRSEIMWLSAPISMYRSPIEGRVRDMVWKA
jgi:hypothetical protein